MHRYEYTEESRRLVVRMPTAVHEVFIARIEDAVFSEVKLIREGSDEAAAFARRINPARCTEIHLPIESGTSKHEPDAAFWHDSAQYPGVIIEVAYSQKSRELDRRAEDYLLDSDNSVRVVVGLTEVHG